MTDQGTPRPHRPRPIDSAVVEPLAGRAQTIAKGWLLLLLERAPLDAVGAIPAAALAAEGPALCAALVRALGSDRELARLGRGGELEPMLRRIGPLAGAEDATATVAAVDALRACIWDVALEDRAERADVAAVRALAERLAQVAAVVTAGALGEAPASPAAAGVAAPAPAPAPGPAPAEAADPTALGGPAAPVAPSAFVPTTPSPPVAPPPAAPPPPVPAEPLAGGGAYPAEPGPEPAIHELRDPQAEGPAGSPVTQLPPRPPGEASDGPTASMDDGDLWIATLERHIDRCQREGGGLALLRVELVDAERIVASAPEGQAGVPYGRLAQAIRRAIRRQDLVASDHQGRAWVIAPGVGRAGAIALGERIGAGVEQGETWRGGPLSATIGFAVYGEDGRDAATLIERSEEAMLAATAAGVRIGEAIPVPDDDPGRPAGPGPRLVR